MTCPTGKWLKQGSKAMKYIMIWLFSALAFLLSLLVVYLATLGSTGWYMVILLSFLIGTALTRMLEDAL